MHCLRDWSNRFSNNKACRGRFSIVDGHGFEFILRGAMEVECKPSSKHLVDEVKNKDDLLTGLLDQCFLCPPQPRNRARTAIQKRVRSRSFHHTNPDVLGPPHALIY